MSEFNPSKLFVEFDPRLTDGGSTFPRRYTLTHSDRTGDLFLTIGRTYDHKKISNWYVRLMRDEVLGEWRNPEKPALHLYCHVSGGFTLGPAKWRLSILQYHLPMVLHAIGYGDRVFIINQKTFQKAPIMVHFRAKQASLNKVEQWGTVEDALPEVD